MLNIKKTVENNKAVFALEGRLDTVTSPELDEALAASLDGITDITLDLTELSYISSAGLRVLLAAQKAIDGRGTMKVMHVNEAVMDVFEVTGFSDILTIE